MVLECPDDLRGQRRSAHALPRGHMAFARRRSDGAAAGECGTIIGDTAPPELVLGPGSAVCRRGI